MEENNFSVKTQLCLQVRELQITHVFHIRVPCGVKCGFHKLLKEA